MKRLVTALFAFFLIFAVGCKGEEIKSPKKPAEPAPPAEKPVKRFLIGFAQSTFEDPWRIHMNDQLKEAVEKREGIKLVTADGQNRNDKQIADVQNFITRGVDLLIISPREAAPLTAVVAKAYDRGIPVIVLDRKVKGDKYTCFIGASNLEIGRAAGEYIASLLPDGGMVVEIEGILGATPTQERHQGFREAVKANPKIQVIHDQPGDYKRSPAKRIMDNALQAHKKIDVVYAHNDEMAIGAFLAAKAVGREKDMIFVGIDGQGEAITMIRNGDLHATFVYPNGGYEAIDMAVKVLAGEEAPKNITLETTRITKDENPEIKGF